MTEKPARHMPLPEWDKKVAVFLDGIRGRAKWLRVDANQIKDWVKRLPAVPDFDTEAHSLMVEARDALKDALEAIDTSIKAYEQKEKVT